MEEFVQKTSPLKLIFEYDYLPQNYFHQRIYFQTTLLIKRRTLIQFYRFIY